VIGERIYDEDVYSHSSLFDGLLNLGMQGFLLLRP
jgi:hypothetical protein